MSASPSPRRIRRRGRPAAQKARHPPGRARLKSGLNHGYYGDVERGERNIALANILKIADALELPASEIPTRAEQFAQRAPLTGTPDTGAIAGLLGAPLPH